MSFHKALDSVLRLALKYLNQYNEPFKITCHKTKFLETCTKNLKISYDSSSNKEYSTLLIKVRSGSTGVRF